MGEWSEMFSGKAFITDLGKNLKTYNKRGRGHHRKVCSLDTGGKRYTSPSCRSRKRC